ncbi:threonine/serine exporter family protein [Enterococcus dongliensis]|uniref:Threonine/serine exporter family protein n=1 Tax=Enterococcus dongliensis TaxID=2559925 RepID=A0AAP5NN13_9ENTE|nr:threonine/serine exporter family protein [Enterococcus dongliensis]MDT2597883.1 threonine/serine exporter family protein [Enterococcus dongliensis]MDT2604689.1 threonine/serine exporter family protein [Enterococcus dongliensis]MDT2614383.1 threonine/serine exporter family protein [Enterococcus dongliensis]MDT2635472.1 threonine/serine exporter family protein [Enterococcus dongliensis]MDT2637689.1 threonine/serine exporter family protein [Enterococcus dongliensis]
MEQQNYTQLVLNTCLKAGKIMMESGSEVYRVEDTMKRIALNAGLDDIQTYVTATGLIIGFPSEQNSQVVQITPQSINLEKVTAVNQGSRQFADGELSLPDFYLYLEEVDQATPDFPYLWKIIAAGIVSSTLMIILNGTWFDFIPTFIIGMIGFAVHTFFGRKLQMNFLNDFVAALIIGYLALLAVSWSVAKDVNSLIIGSIMPLVPGLAITNAFRDIMAGHLISGVARGTEALFIAGAIGGGIIIAFNFF